MKNKTKIILLIGILVVVCVVLIVGMIFVINGKFKSSHFVLNSKISNNLVLDKKYSGDFQEIDVDSNSSEVYIGESINNEIRLVIHGDKDLITVNASGGKLNINSKNKKCVGFCFNLTVAKIEIYLPRDYSNNVKVYNNYGDVEVGDFPKASIDISEDCGDVEVHGGRKVKVNNDYGDVELGNVAIAEVEESCGDVKIDQVKDVSIKNNYGDVEIERVTDYLNISNDCGDIEIDEISLNRNSYISNNFGDVEIGMTNEIFIEAQTDLGDVNIKNNYHKANVVLKIDNDCGDINV